MEKLYAFEYLEEHMNEFDRLMDLWTDVEFLKNFAQQNSVKDVQDFIEDVLRNAEQIEDFLNEIYSNNQPFGFYFEPLQESERKTKVLALHKGKIRKNRLRLYALKIDNNCFVITGGAIKMSQKMDEHSDTANELIKLKRARVYLQNENVFDEDSFFELITEHI